MARPSPRLFVSASLGQSALTLTPEQIRYLGAVLRLPVGAEVRLFNGKDGEWVYRIAALDRRSGAVAPVQQRRLQIERTEAPQLLFAPVKRQPTETLVQKAVELGVMALQPVLTERTVRPELNLQRLTTIAIEAAEQCERLTIPTIKPPVKLLSALQPEEAFIFCDEAGDSPAEPWGGDTGRAQLPGEVLGKVTAVPEKILIGPEGGFTEGERRQLRAHPGALPLSLGPRILRAETAGIVALTLWQSRFGDLA